MKRPKDEERKSVNDTENTNGKRSVKGNEKESGR